MAGDDVIFVFGVIAGAFLATPLMLVFEVWLEMKFAKWINKAGEDE